MSIPRKIALIAFVTIVTALVLNARFEPEFRWDESGAFVSIYIGEVRDDPGAYRYLECVLGKESGCDFSIDP